MGRYAPPWDVSNYGEGSAGIVDLEEATVKSYNTVFAQLIMQAQPQHAMNVATRLGIRSPLEPVPAAVLGTNDVTTLDMAGAYGTFANRGVHNPPVLVTRITRADGTVLYEHDAVRARVLSQGVADTVTGVLRQAVDAEPAPERRSGGRSPARPAPRSSGAMPGSRASRPISSPPCGSGSQASRSRCSRRAPRSA